MKYNDLGLGRKHKPDTRDEKFLIKSLLPKKISATSKSWYANGWWGDQGDTSNCVGYSWTHWLEDGPVPQIGKAPIVRPEGIVALAKKVDEFAGEDYEGTSVRAGAKVIATLGFIKEYRWTWQMSVLIDTLLTLGPVVVGTNWYNSMFIPNKKNFLEIEGRVAGGHAYLLNGINMKEEKIRIKNSWGRSWANKGHAYISFENMERLINEDGEVCLAVEIQKK